MRPDGWVPFWTGGTAHSKFAATEQSGSFSGAANGDAEAAVAALGASLKSASLSPSAKVATGSLKRGSKGVSVPVKDIKKGPVAPKKAPGAK